MKTIIRLLMLLLMLSGWALAALSVHIVRVPDPNNAQESKLVIVPKDRLGFDQTYVDARNWNRQDVLDHAALVDRIKRAGKADLLKFAAGPSRSSSLLPSAGDQSQANAGRTIHVDVDY